MTHRLEFGIVVALPEDALAAATMQTKVLQLAEGFKSALAKDKIDAVVSTRVVRVKETKAKTTETATAKIPGFEHDPSLANGAEAGANKPWTPPAQPAE